MLSRCCRTLKLAAYGFGRAKPSNEDIIPLKDIKSISSGEDAYFIKGNKFGIADGVGAWKESKGSSSFVSEKLLHYCCIYEEKDVVNLLNKAYQQTLYDMYKLNIKGSSTVLIAQLLNSSLHIASLGDCQMLIYRHSELVFKSEDQYHFFNCPYQLGTNSINSPNDSQVVKFPIELGDIIVCGSDGLFDNLWEENIHEIIEKNNNNYAKCPELLVNEAIFKSTDPSYDESPFQLKASEEGLYHIGGKLDDTTVIIAKVVE